jgi:hypothetical protein
MATTPADADPRDADPGPDRLIQWVPLVVPLFALLIAALVYFIGAEVL